MTGYLPASPIFLPLMAGVLTASVTSGLVLTRKFLRWGRAAAWAVLLVSVFFAERLTREEPGGLRMLAICAALFFGFKSVVGTQDLAEGGTALSADRWLGFVLTWPGMNPATFSRRGARLPGAANLIGRGIAELSAGIAMTLFARWLWLRTHQPLLATGPLLIGLSLIGHFGLFSLSAGLWRLRGVPCVAPFQAPLASTSLSEFWSRRWNRPFSELIQRIIYRPVSALAGRPAALSAGFLLSGILHELAISVPARAGYGRPLAYFALQGALVIAEKGLVANGYEPRHRFATLFAFTLPLPLLLIPQFFRAAIWPIIGAR